VGSAYSRATVLDRLVGDGEFAEITTHHLRLDLYLIEGLAVVDSNVGTNEFGHNNHITKVGFDHLGLILGVYASSPGLLNALDKRHGTMLESTKNLAARAGGEKLKKALAIDLEKLLELNSTIGELAKRSFLLQINIGDLRNGSES
jgi:hypothetical protein